MRLTVISILGTAATLVTPRVAAVPVEAAAADAAAVCVGISRIVRTMFGVLEIR